MTLRRALATLAARRSMLLVLLMAWLAAQVVISWMPFRIDLPRTVRNGAEFTSNGSLAFSGEPAQAFADPPQPWNLTSRLSVELTVRTDDDDQTGPARIFSIAHDYTSGNLVVGQDGSSLVVRVRHPGSDRLGRPPIRVAGVFEHPGWHRIQVEVDDTVDVTLDGTVVANTQLAGSAFDTWNEGYRIALGDEVGGDRPWKGATRRVHLTVDRTTYDLLAPGALAVPDRFFYVPTRLDDVTDLPDAPAILRSGLHLLAWIPAGLVLATRVSQHKLRSTAAVAATIAVLLQLGKFAVATRHPSLFDAAAQTSGAAAGALLALWARPPSAATTIDKED